MEEVPPPELCVEEVWCGAEGPASIAELALEQRGVHFPLVQHHYLLASLLHSAMTFGLRVKPLSLFDSKVSREMQLMTLNEDSDSPTVMGPVDPESKRGKLDRVLLSISPALDSSELALEQDSQNQQKQTRQISSRGNGSVQYTIQTSR